MIRYIYNDGGRKEAGFKPSGDCVVRAFTILTGLDYTHSRECFAYAQSILGSGKLKARTVEKGIQKSAYEAVFKENGLVKVKRGRRGPLPTYSEAYEVHGNCIVSSTKHLCAIVDGALQDTFDGRGYWWDPGMMRKVGDDYEAGPQGGVTVGRIDGKLVRIEPEWRQRKARSIWIRG